MKKYIWNHRKFQNWEVCVIDEYDKDDECFLLIWLLRLYNLTHQELIEQTIPARFWEIVRFRFNLIFKR